ncbi:MAG: hypothetical protein WCG79_00525 [Verrucomicrobiota bacterium]
MNFLTRSTRLACAGNITTTVSPLIKHTVRVNEMLRLMEDRPAQISILTIFEPDGCCAGVLRLHDIYHPISNV